MSTSGGSWVNALLLLLTVVLAVQIAVLLLDGRRPRVTATACTLWLVVAVPSVLQHWFPALLRGLRRDPDLIRQHGQIWRVLTSVVVQDGGGSAIGFNLVALAVVAVLAADVWGAVLMPVIFLFSQLVFGVVFTFAFPTVGAGNSGATLGLAASLAGLGVLTRREKALRGRGLGVLGVGVALLVIGDGHGIAVLGGLVIGVILASAGRPTPNLWQTRRHHASG
jgi:membrane associated rhomboid family serine protease